MEKEFSIKAIWNKDHYYHFGIHPVTCSLYGHSEDEIVDVKFKISEDQNKPDVNSGSMTPDYWGWYDYSKKEFTMMYAKMFLLNMCFPYGIKAAEDNNDGKAYRVEIF